MKKVSIAVACAAIALSGYSLSLDRIRQSLGEQRCLTATVGYVVYLPTSSDPVQYEVLLTTNNIADSLSPCDYLIMWTLPRGNKVSTGFNSYSRGDHFRYRDTRLQEYHVAEDAAPFTTSGGGVQRTAQFADILPAFLAEKIADIVSDSTYVYDFDEKTNTLSGTQQMRGYDAFEFTYEFDEASGLPVRSDFVFNPASISEQTVNVTYKWDLSGKNCADITEQYLIDLFPEIFEKYRTSNFRVESLRGASLPTMSFMSGDGQRVNHSRGEADLGSPAVLMFADKRVDGTLRFIDSLREATAQLPMSVKVVYVFAEGAEPDEFIATADEYKAVSPESLIRKCGVTAYPTFIVVGSDGSVADVIVGDAADLADKLAQSLMNAG